MPTSPFGLPGAWFRGNLHGHTTESDGTFTPAEYAAFYRGLGHDFTAVTDHRRITDMRAFSDPRFLCIPGVELDGPGPGPAGCDVVALGIADVPPAGELGSLQARLDAVRARGGVAFVAHPYETGITAADLRAHDGYAGIEIWNTLSAVGWGKGLATVQWDEALASGRWVGGFATDDSHQRPEHGPDAGTAWIAVRAEALRTDAILAAIADGRFYASTGPEIHDVRVERDPETGGRIAVARCSPCRRIFLLSDRGLGRGVQSPAGRPITEARRRLHPDATYLRVECVDDAGRTAWSNPILLASPSA